MKNHFFFVSLLIAFNLLSTHLKAQDSLQFIPKIEIGLIQGIGLGFEIPLSQKSVFEIGAGVGSGYTIFENQFENTWAIAQPAFYAQAKYKLYYNRQKRLDKGKSVLNNSGNYVGFRFKYASRELSPDNLDGLNIYQFHKVTLFDVHWGIQRSMGKRFLFNLNLGLGYGYDWDLENGMIYPAGDVRFAYKLWK
ncbi:hypothetical protein [Bernardetia sp. MNP-M8]|uniref:hypothetical protein n=1 Tax=Bernardetia sp. MNP-M8 TaxID=3127470 RepID=UPI0030CAA6AF